MRSALRACVHESTALRANAATADVRSADSTTPVLGRASAAAPARLLLLLASCLCAIVAMPGQATAASVRHAGLRHSAEAKVVKELPELRTATSDTYLRSDGTRLAKSFPGPVNYQASPGTWTPINDQLILDASGNLHPRASGVPVSLPASLGSGPVSFGAPGQEVAISLQGASLLAAATPSGDEGSYSEALPGVDASYRLNATSLRETLTLANASAPTVYRYDLSLSAGLKATAERWGGLDIKDASGNSLYRLAPPTVRDSSGRTMSSAREVHYELSRDGHTLTLVLNGSWLHASDRVFPVRIDPDISYYNDESDCDIINGPEASTSLCGLPLYIGSNGEPVDEVGRALLRFDLSSLPQDSQVLNTRMSMYFFKANSSTAQTLQAYALNRNFTSNATWETYDGAHNWAAAGGDYSALSLPGGGSQPYGERTYYNSSLEARPEIGITPLVQKWIAEPSTNYGLLIKDSVETSSQFDGFEPSGGVEGGPSLEVVYSPRVGTPTGATQTSTPVDDRAAITVNAANGNLLMDNHELNLPGVGYDFSLEAYYNNQNNEIWGPAGHGTTFSNDVYLRNNSYDTDESLQLHEASGTWSNFTREKSADKEGDKAYLSPPGMNATLVVHPDYSATMTYTLSRVKVLFEAETELIEKIIDPNGNTTKFTYSYINGEWETKTVTDTDGHVLKYAYEGYNEDLSSVEDALGRKWGFSQNSENQLTSMSDPDGHKLQYAYDEDGDLKQITDPNGNLIELSYDSSRRVTKIRRVINGTATTTGNKDVITTLAYSIPASSEAACPTGSVGDTVIVSPNGSPNGEVNSKSSEHKTTYCYNTSDQVTKTIDQSGNATTASYSSAFGQLTKYQNPGDTAGGLNVDNTIAYNPSGAPTEISYGTGTSSTLDTTLGYGGGSGNGGQVEPSAIHTPFSAPKQKEKGAHQAFYGYDASGNLTSVRQDKENEGEGQPEVKLKYNAKGQVTESTDPDGNTTKYKYNEKNDLVKIEPPSPLKATELTYDAIDRVHTVKDGLETTATYTYDGEDRVTKVEYSDGSSISFKFDANGNTTERVDAKSFGEPYTGVTSYEYDKLNRPTLETTPTAKTTRYGYDYDGNLTSLEDAGGTVAYAYGPDDLLTSLTEPENSSHPFKFGYETGDDSRESTKFPNGLLQCTKTDPGGRLTKLLVFKPTGEQNCSSTISPSATLESYGLLYSLEFEEEGHKEAIDTPDVQTLFNFKAETTTTYSYDTLDRLLTAVVTNSGGTPLTSEYEYDKAGNMLLNHSYSPSTTYSNNHNKYNAANEICAIATTTPSACASPSEPGIAGEPTYDANGNMTSDGLLGGANKFAYTVRDQLSSVTPHGESAKQVVSHGTGQDDLAALGSEEVITNVLGVGVTGSGESAKYYTRGSEGTLLAKRTAKGKPSETEYFTLDPFGSVALLTTAGGSQTAPTSGTYQYDPFGAAIGAAATSFGFESGQVLPSGIVHFGARYLAPSLGSWTQQDPVNALSDLIRSSRYTYADGNPVNKWDGSGERPAGDTADEFGATEPGICVWAEHHSNRYWERGSRKHILVAAWEECDKLDEAGERRGAYKAGDESGEALSRWKP
jgi:RHS repeat-associated protein